MQDILRFAIKEAERAGADDVEVYSVVNREYEVFIENNDLKQAKSNEVGSIGIRVLLKKSLGFSSVNSLRKDQIIGAVTTAIKIAKVSPPDKFNSMPGRSKIHFLKGIYDKRAESFRPADAAMLAAEMLDSAKSFDRRVSVDSGNFNSSLLTHSLSNSNGMEAKENISTFSWSIMGMAVEEGEVSSFDSQFGGVHHIKKINVSKTAKEFAETVVSSLGSKKIDSFKGEMLLAPPAAAELVEEVVAHSINSDAVQKKSSHFAGKVGSKVSSSLLAVEDDAINPEGLGASSFDREGVPRRRNKIIEKGVLKKFIYNTYTANKDGVKSTGNAGGSASSPPAVSTTNFMIGSGRSSYSTLVSEMKSGIIINRFSGNVNPVNGDFSGVVKGGQLVKNGSIECAVKEVMVAGNVFECLINLNGVSKERKMIYSSTLPYMRFGTVSFTAG